MFTFSVYNILTWLFKDVIILSTSLDESGDLMKLDTSTVKKNNLKIIKNTLRESEYATKNELSKTTGISVSSITTLLSELIDTGEVLELELASPNGGRPARRFQYNSQYKYILLLSLRKEDNVESITYHICDLLGNNIETKYIEVTVKLYSITSLIDQLMRKYNKIGYISLGIPGIIQKGKIYSCDIVSLSGLELNSFIEERYKVKSSLENDVNAIAYGYYNTLKEKQSTESLVYLYYPSNGDPGAGIVVNNQVVRGFQNLAGELKYLEINRQRKLSKRILSMIHILKYTINPEHIIISGKDIKVNEQSYILAELIKDSFNPTVLFEPNIEEYYLLGLKQYLFEYIKGV